MIPEKALERLVQTSISLGERSYEQGEIRVELGGMERQARSFERTRKLFESQIPGPKGRRELKADMKHQVAEVRRRARELTRYSDLAREVSRLENTIQKQGRILTK